MLRHWIYVTLMTLVGFSGQVLAHAGSHAEFSSWQQVTHYLSQPYHIMGIVSIAVVIMGVVFWRQWHRR